MPMAAVAEVLAGDDCRAAKAGRAPMMAQPQPRMAQRVCFGNDAKDGGESCGGKVDSGEGCGGEVWLGDNLPVLRRMPSASVNLIYIDPPFNTGKTQTRKSIRVRRADIGNNGGDAFDNANGDNTNRADDNANRNNADRAGDNFDGGDAFGRRVGFGGHCYDAVVVGETGYADSFADYEGFLRPRLQEAHRLLCDNGSLFFHIDWRESARCRLLLEEVFGGGDHCINELIWAYDFGGRGKSKWPAKHDNIYWFAKNPADYTFNYDAQDRIAYMAPGLVGNEKAARGKTPTDVWWNTIVPTNGKEKTGYATQKPLAILDRIVRVHSNPGDVVLDFFAGSGTTGIACANNRRRFVLIDENPQAFAIMQKRIAAVLPVASNAPDSPDSPTVKKTTTPKKIKEK